ncbi:MAG: glycoside hydrolase family 3 protein, partial [Anaerolineaceae bacterium]
MNEPKQIKINNIINKMTLYQKISFLCGKNFWQTKDFPELGIPLIEVADGPYGVRKQTGIHDHMGWNKSLPATAYPSGPSMAASWDESLAKELGEYLGAEAHSFGIDILLGPAINIVRTPLCGRNFEYFSEDPYLAGNMASAYINGLKNQNVGACVKHFAVNNQETDREYINVDVDERTLREIYLAAFEEVIKSASPISVMAALNKVNGYYCSENKTLLTDILRDEWKFSGIVMSDWFGVNDMAAAVLAGLDLEMPVNDGSSVERIKNELNKGGITEEDINACVYRLISVALEID